MNDEIFNEEELFPDYNHRSQSKVKPNENVIKAIYNQSFLKSVDHFEAYARYYVDIAVNKKIKDGNEHIKAGFNLIREAGKTMDVAKIYKVVLPAIIGKHPDLPIIEDMYSFEDYIKLTDNHVKAAPPVVEDGADHAKLKPSALYSVVYKVMINFYDKTTKSKMQISIGEAIDMLAQQIANIEEKAVPSGTEDRSLNSNYARRYIMRELYIPGKKTNTVSLLLGKISLVDDADRDNPYMQEAFKRAGCRK
jgi:hypothetical protein